VPAASLAHLGWDETLAPSLPLDGTPGRVVRADRGLASLETADGPLRAATRDPVAVGDWVAVSTDPPRS